MRQREGRSAEIVDDGCKAIQSGRFAVAIAGMAVLSQTGFSVATVIAGLPRTEGTLAMFSEAVSVSVSDALSRTLRLLKQMTPSAYSDAVAIGRTTVIIAGQQGNGWYRLLFSTFTSASWPARFESCCRPPQALQRLEHSRWPEKAPL